MDFKDLLLNFLLKRAMPRGMSEMCSLIHISWTPHFFGRFLWNLGYLLISSIVILVIFYFSLLKIFGELDWHILLLWLYSFFLLGLLGLIALAAALSEPPIDETTMKRDGYKLVFLSSYMKNDRQFLTAEIREEVVSIFDRYNMSYPLSHSIIGQDLRYWGLGLENIGRALQKQDLKEARKLCKKYKK